MELPPGGAEAISHEDLRRDVRRFSTEPAEAAFLDRLRQMQFAEVSEGEGTCATRAGKPGGAPLLLVARMPTNAAEATAAAGLVSIAKAWDLEGGPPGPRTLCLLAAEAPLPPGGFLVGPIASGPLVLSAEWAHADAAEAGLPAERVNYTDVQARVGQLYRALPGATKPGPTPRSP